MLRQTTFRVAALGVALAAAGCAGARPRAETVATQRRGDTAPDKRAALRAATPGLDLEAEDARWGIEAAKTRKHGPDTRATTPPPAPVTGASTIGVKAPPTP